VLAAPLVLEELLSDFGEAAKSSLRDMRRGDLPVPVSIWDGSVLTGTVMGRSITLKSSGIFRAETSKTSDGKGRICL